MRARIAVLLVALAACGERPASPSSEGTPRVASDVRRVMLTEDLVEFTLGDSARRFTAVVERSSGRVDTVPAAQVTARDTNVVRVEDGAMLPLAVGQTRLDFRVEGQSIRGLATVRERIFSDSVWIGPGEVRAWDLRPAWYRITVDAVPFPGEPQTLELGADLICVPEAREAKTIACRVTKNTRVILRHTGVSKRADKALAVVSIYRTAR